MKEVTVHLSWNANRSKSFVDPDDGLHWEIRSIGGVDGYLCICQLTDIDDDDILENRVVATFAPGVWRWVHTELAMTS